MDFRSTPLIAFVFLAVAIHSGGEALQCHQCSSYTQAQCADPFFFEPTSEGEERTPKTTEFLKDCPDDGNTYTLCRKIYQNVRGDERIIRSCGWLEHKNECYKTVLEEYNTYVCTCKEDGCNGSSNINMSLFSILASTILAVYFK